MLKFETLIDALVVLSLPLLLLVDIHILILERILRFPAPTSDALALLAVGLETFLAAATLYSHLLVVGAAAPAARFVHELVVNAMTSELVVLHTEIVVKLSVFEATLAAVKAIGAFGAAVLALIASLLNVAIVIVTWFPRFASLVVVSAVIAQQL